MKRPQRVLPLSRVYGYIEPGPVVLVSSSRDGVPNVMPMSWHMMVEFEPPLIACVLSDRNHTFKTVRKTRECVIAIPTVGLARKVVACGNCSGRDVEKFRDFGLTPLPASIVQAPLIAECCVNLECVLADARLVAKYCLFIWEVKKAWIEPGSKNPRTIHHRGYGNFAVAARNIHVMSRMR
jgi:flavin reductase (DIM6/NTAB) family NADH-FMN oxidoreductase RutF